MILLRRTKVRNYSLQMPNFTNVQRMAKKGKTAMITISLQEHLIIMSSGGILRKGDYSCPVKLLDSYLQRYLTQKELPISHPILI